MRLDKLTEIKRLVIYFFYDADGIVDRYVPYMLEEMAKNCNDLFIVCNGKLTTEGRKTFASFTADVLVRENIGFDVWAYKEALEHIGWEKLGTYDEVVLMNYTVFGPLYPFSEMFKEMESRDVDFWGITKHHKVDFDCFKTCKYKYIPEHIQSNFLVIRKSLINSMEYRDFWEKMPMINSYGDSVGLYEAIFTKDFTDKGFVPGVYIDTSDLEGYTRYPLLMMSNELIINRHCPILKVKSFSQNYYDILGDTIGNATIDTFEFIKDHLDYDVDMIWEHILRVFNMADVKKLMHLNYILPQDYVQVPPDLSKDRIALMMHIYYEDLIDYCLHYADSMPDGSDLYITVPNEKMKAIVEERAVELTQFARIKVITIENVGRDVSALLVGCAPYVSQYDYICFVHDKKTKQIKPYTAGESFAYKCFENNLATKEYVKNVIATFQLNPRLGLLTPPPPNHSGFYQIVGSEWAGNFANTMSLAHKLNIHCNIDSRKEPIAPLGTMFWFRTKAMKPLFEKRWKYEYFPKEPNANDGTLLHAIERIYTFVVQSEGYYSAWGMTDKSARVELTNLHFMLREINLKLFNHYYTDNLLDMTEKIERNMYSSFTGSLQRKKRRREKKENLRKWIPQPLWRVCKKIYHVFGGKKWLDETLC